MTAVPGRSRRVFWIIGAALLVAAVAPAAVAPGMVAAQAEPPAPPASPTAALPTDGPSSAGTSAASAASPATAVAVDAQLQLQALELSERLNCPTCQGYNLRDCPLQVCAQMREQIRQQLRLGQSEQEIVDGFVAYYGPQALNAPPTRGFWWLAWLAPAMALTAGGVAVWRWLEHRGVDGAQVGRAGTQADPDAADARYVAAFERLAGRERPGSDDAPDDDVSTREGAAPADGDGTTDGAAPDRSQR